MYICPTCGKRFAQEEKITKHFLACWKEKNPYHVSKDAPRGEDKETREVSAEVANFFDMLGVK